jgi:hypothetical protein
MLSRRNNKAWPTGKRRHAEDGLIQRQGCPAVTLSRSGLDCRPGQEADEPLVHDLLEPACRKPHWGVLGCPSTRVRGVILEPQVHTPGGNPSARRDLPS